MNIGIVGAEAAKFTVATQREARNIIRTLLSQHGDVLVSGHCHLGGVDIWAEEEAIALGRPMRIYPPATHSWSTGYKLRNLRIARTSDCVAVIVLREYPPGYAGRRFPLCYHCNSTEHVKSGACWTAHQAKKLGKPAQWFVL